MTPALLPGRLKKLIWEAPERSGKKLRQVNEEMNIVLSDIGEDEISYGHLSSKMLPDGNGKLDPLQFMALISVTDFLPLDEMERSLGRVAFPLPRVSPNSQKMLMQSVAEATHEFSEWMEKVSRFMSPESESGSELSANEALQLILEGDDVMQVFAERRAYLQEIIVKAINH